jgi:hypothetical protein
MEAQVDPQEVGKVVVQEVQVDPALEVVEVADSIQA